MENAHFDALLQQKKCKGMKRPAASNASTAAVGKHPASTAAMGPAKKPATSYQTACQEAQTWWAIWMREMQRKQARLQQLLAAQLCWCQVAIQGRMASLHESQWQESLSQNNTMERAIPKL